MLRWRPVGKETTALLLPASVWGCSHTLAGFWWVADPNRVSKDPKPTLAVLGRAVVWDPEHHQGDLHHLSILQFSFNSTDICLSQSRNAPALGVWLC